MCTYLFCVRVDPDVVVTTSYVNWPLSQSRDSLTLLIDHNMFITQRERATDVIHIAMPTVRDQLLCLPLVYHPRQ